MATKRELQIAEAIKQAVIRAWDLLSHFSWDRPRVGREDMETVDVEAILDPMAITREAERKEFEDNRLRGYIPPAERKEFEDNRLRGYIPPAEDFERETAGGGIQQ